MYLLQALSIDKADDLDVSRPANFGSIELSSEATAEAVRIVNGGDFETQVNICQIEIDRPQYWAIIDASCNFGEIFLLPKLPFTSLPTAIEIGIVRSLAALDPISHSEILAGGLRVSIGPPQCTNLFEKVIEKCITPISGNSILWSGGADIYLSADSRDLLSDMPVKCIHNSFRAAPLKFRFIELYRVMEALYIAEIKRKLLVKFSTDPGTALSEAQERMKSELKQIEALAEGQKDAFEQCWQEFDKIRNSNRFVAALFKKLDNIGGNYQSPKWKSGAALVYIMRCAIVHAGQKDLIFDNFPDGDEAVEAIIEKVERASLMLVGIEVV